MFKTYSRLLNKIGKPGPWLYRTQPEATALPNQRYATDYPPVGELNAIRAIPFAPIGQSREGRHGRDRPTTVNRSYRAKHALRRTSAPGYHAPNNR